MDPGLQVARAQLRALVLQTYWVHFNKEHWFIFLNSLVAPACDCV